jgi:hypothetical protein
MQFKIHKKMIGGLIILQYLMHLVRGIANSSRMQSFFYLKKIGMYGGKKEGKINDCSNQTTTFCPHNTEKLEIFARK